MSARRTIAALLLAASTHAAPTPVPRVLAVKADPEAPASATSANRLDARAVVPSGGSTPDDAASDLASLQAFVDGVFAATPPADAAKVKAGREADAKSFRRGIP